VGLAKQAAITSTAGTATVGFAGGISEIG